MKLTDYLAPIAFLFVLCTIAILVYRAVTQTVDGFTDSMASALQQVVTLANARMNGRQNMNQMLSYYTSATTPDSVPEE